MGTSKRSINDSIKNILKDVPFDTINSKSPEVSKKIITEKRIVKELGDNSVLERCIGIVGGYFQKIKVEGFEGSSYEELKKGSVSTEEFINTIIDEIDSEESVLLDKHLLEKSLKMTLTDCVMNDELDVEYLVIKLLLNVVNNILSTELHDTLKDIYGEIEYEQIDNMIKNLSKKIVHLEVNSKIKGYIAKEVSYEEMIAEVVKSTEAATFGEF